MPALKITDIIEQGATYQRAFAVNNADGSPFDLSGCTCRAQLRNDNGELIATFTVGTVDYKVVVELSATQTTGLTATTSYFHTYDVEVETATGIVYRIAQVRVTISAEQTK